MSIPPAVVIFQDRNYCYKSVTIQITHDDELAPIRPMGKSYISDTYHKEIGNNTRIWLDGLRIGIIAEPL